MGSTCWSREVRVLRSRLDTMGDMCSNYTRQLIGHMRLRELFSPPDKQCGFGEAHSGLEICLDLSMT